MANEASIKSGLTINKGNLRFVSQPQGFNADVSGTKGPVPGAFTASTDGTDVDLSELVNPGLCVIQNLDSANFVRVGRWDGQYFYPLMRVLAGESYTIRLDLEVDDEFTGTGTATTSASTTLRVKADTAPVDVVVSAFES